MLACGLMNRSSKMSENNFIAPTIQSVCGRIKLARRMIKWEGDRAGSFQHPTKLSSWWRCLQDALIKTNIYKPFQEVFKTSSKRLAKSSSRHLQDVFKTFWRRLQDFLKTYYKDIFKMFSRRIILRWPITVTARKTKPRQYKVTAT